MIVTRTEKHIIKSTHTYYELLKDYTHKSKNLYNFANYHIRQTFFKEKNETTGKAIYLNYNKIDKLLKTKEMDFDYRAMPLASCAQQTLMLLDRNWRSFLSAIKDFMRHPEKYTGRPQLPKYLAKDGYYILVLSNGACKLKDQTIHFSKVFNGLTLRTKIKGVLQQIRILPRANHFVIEIVYKIGVVERKEDNGKVIGVDIGIDNLAAIANNVSAPFCIINGKGLKSINKYYNKLKSRYQATAKQMNNLYYTDRLNRLNIKRNNLITNFMHEASKKIIDYALSCNANTIVIGNNKDWKRESKLSKKVNQSFVGIPHQDFINKIIYKAENVGINVILSEESYTSGTSFLDNELPIEENYNKSRRRHRGLFVSNKGKLINADINGACQIIKKYSQMPSRDMR